MFTLGTPLWEIIARTVAVYLVLLIGFRLTGKREIGQITIFDLVLLLLVSNAVQNAMVGPDSSLTGGIVAAAILMGLNVALSHLGLRWPRLRRLIIGTPTVLILHGEAIPSHLRHEGLDEEDLETALREHGVASVGDVEMAVLEVDGSISVVPAGQTTKRMRRSSRHARPL